MIWGRRARPHENLEPSTGKERMSALSNSDALLVVTVGAIMLLVLIAGMIKNAAKGLGWVLGFIVLAITGYLYVSSDVLPLP